MRNLILTGLVIALTASSAMSGESLSPERLLPGAGTKDAYRPAAAACPSTPSTSSGQVKDIFFVVWQAGRMQEGDIVGCRLDRSGKVLDAAPFAVSAAKDDQEEPRVAFGNSVFLVVWQDLRNEKDYDLYAARVSADGKVLDAEGILVSGGANNQCRPSVAFDGGNFVVAWQDLRDGKAYRIYGARVSAEGKVLDQEGVLLSGAKEFHQTVAVASAGDGRTLVAWGSTNRGAGGIPEGIFVREGKATGLAIPPCSSRDVPKGLAKSVYAMKGLYPALAAGKDSFLLAWRNYLPAGRGGNGTRACCQVVSADGKRGELLTFTGKAQVAIDPQVVWDGVAYVAAWGDICETRKKGQNAQPGVFVNRLGKDGKPLCPAERASGSWESPAQRPALASDGAGTTLVTYEKHPATADVPIKIAFRLLRAK